MYLEKGLGLLLTTQVLQKKHLKLITQTMLMIMNTIPLTGKKENLYGKLLLTPEILPK